jgi:hypothetical protein
MPPVGFEPAIPASERPQTHALDPAATGIDSSYNTNVNITKKKTVGKRGWGILKFFSMSKADILL